MKKILDFFSNPIVIAIIGLILISLLIWFAGPQIKFGANNTAPLGSPIVRMLCIMVLLILWGLNNLRIQMKNNKQNNDLVDELKDSQNNLQDPGSEQASEELYQINQRFGEALATLKKLKFSGKGRKKALYELPWYIIIGPPGAGKTTALINSSLEFPLAEKFGKGALQGVGGTRNCDWWFTNDAVLVDTAGRYTTQDSHKVIDHSAWEGFLNLLKRHRRRRPINGAIVAISLHDLMTQTEEERLQNAKTIRSRLDELMAKLQIRMPIYLMFTKADLISGFTEFFEDLSREDCEQVWGVSLPNAPDPSQSPDFDFLSQEFTKLLERLNDRVLWRMHQERDPRRRGLIRGFPLQMETLRSLMEQFVHQTFTKNRYQLQPYLRGIYLTSGVQDGNVIDRLMTSVAANFGLSREVQASPMQQGKSFFLGNLFRRVIFPESELVGLNVRYEIFRLWAQRGIYLALAGAVVGALLIWAGSINRNQVYMAEVDDYATEFTVEEKRLGTRGGRDIRTVLPRLNALARASIVYDQESHPWLSGMGLYDGRVDIQANRAYTNQLRHLLLPQLIDQLESYIRQGHEGGDLYNTFRTYMMFQKVEYLDKTLITDWFHGHWERQFLGEGTKRKELEAHLQALLALEPEPQPLDDKLIADTRALLLRVPVSQRIYSRIRTSPEYYQPIDMLNYFGESVRRVYRMDEATLDALQVPYMFTIEGYKAIDLSPDSPVVANIVRERWVLTDDDSARVDFIEEDLAEVSEQVKDHYLSEYERVWQRVYQSLHIAEFNNIRQANDALTNFTDPVYSPLLSILEVGRENTQLSSPVLQNLADDHSEGRAGRATSYLEDRFQGNKVDQRFRDLNVLLRESSKRPPPINTTMQQLQHLQNFIGELATAPAPSKKAFDISRARIQGGSGNAITALRGYAKNTPEPVKRWLDALADQTWKVVLRSARGHINAEWRAQVYTPYAQGLAGRYPLSGGASNELAVFDFSEFFKPGGSMDSFFEAYMKPFINTRGGWQNRGGDNRSLGFSANTLAQVRKAVTIRDVFFRNNPESPSLALELKPYGMDERHARFTLDIGDERITYKHGPKFWKTVNWAAGSGNQRIRVAFEELDGRVHARSYTGPWSWFRLQDVSEIRRTSRSNVYLITFSVKESGGFRSHDITFQLRAKSVNNPFRRNFLSSFRCPESI